MESGAYKLLESATQRTLHANAFSRSSSQASNVLTDLLSRYLALLSSTAAKHAHHAGRSSMTVRDVLASLDELGVSFEELTEYCATEGKELNRYALYSARRVEDLHDFRAQLSEGLRQDRDDAIPLVWEFCPSHLLEEMDESSSEDEDDTLNQEQPYRHHNASGDMDVDPSPSAVRRPPSRPATPPLPLSPISNPSSPRRKRPRHSNWDAPDYVPDFLPPFPSLAADKPPSPTDPTPTPQTQPTVPLPSQPEASSDKQTPAMLISQSLTTAAASDILVQVPYEQSSLASVSERHLPPPVPPPSTIPVRQKLPTPQIEPSLLSAFHHILTHPPPKDLPPLNPWRHKVAMALIDHGEANPRWNPADSLFGSIAPCPPRVATIGPSYPVAISDTPGGKDIKLPPSIPRPVNPVERMAPFISQQTSRIPELAQLVLPPAILSRTSRLAHPPVLHRGSKALVYGNGIPAPWNSGSTSGGDAVPPTPQSGKPKEGNSNSRDKEDKRLLPDARLYATWDHESKDFRVPLTQTRGRSRMGSVPNLQGSSGSGVISLPSGVRKVK